MPTLPFTAHNLRIMLTQHKTRGSTAVATLKQAHQNIPAGMPGFIIDTSVDGLTAQMLFIIDAAPMPADENPAHFIGHSKICATADLQVQGYANKRAFNFFR